VLVDRGHQWSEPAVVATGPAAAAITNDDTDAGQGRWW
jgi:hypothetical protein